MKKINDFIPNNVNDIFGHDELFKENSILSNLIKQKILVNLILCGPSGIGKTTILNLLVNLLDIDVLEFNPLIDKKEKLLTFLSKKSIKEKIVLINEIHNMSKNKQDILLEALQNKQIYLFASTNINPYLNLNNALISRCFLILLDNISEKDLKKGLINITQKYDLKKDYVDVIDLIIKYINNDIRKAVNTLILIINLYDDKKIDLRTIETFIKNNQVFNSISSTQFHDLKSAFHKSLRGSDANAALYYLYKLMQIGDYKAIYRRLIAACYEDVGLANPNLSIRVMNAINACEFLGEKESFEVLAFISIEIALSPKSNSAYMALERAKTFIESNKDYEIPTYLKNGSLKFDSRSKHKVSYLYPHNYKNNWINQQYLPDEIKNERFYIPNEYSKYEVQIQEYWKKIKNNE